MNNENILSKKSAKLDPLFERIYYSTEGYWKGYSAIPKLAEKAKVSENEAKQWLEKQANMANLSSSSQVYTKTTLDCRKT